MPEPLLPAGVPEPLLPAGVPEPLLPTGVPEPLLPAGVPAAASGADTKVHDLLEIPFGNSEPFIWLLPIII